MNRRTVIGPDFQSWSAGESGRVHGIEAGAFIASDSIRE
jgi:hypothetical protein